MATLPCWVLNVSFALMFLSKGISCFSPVYKLNTYALSSSLIQFAFTFPREVRIDSFTALQNNGCSISHREFPGIFFGRTMAIIARNFHLIDSCGVDIAISMNVYRGVAINTFHSSFKMYIFSYM